MAIPLLAGKAAAAGKVLATIPPEVIKEVGVIIKPLVDGLGKTVASLSSPMDALVEMAIGSERRRMLEAQADLVALQQRVENEELIVKAKIAATLFELSAKERRACISFLNYEIRTLRKEYLEALLFFKLWIEDIKKGLHEYREDPIIREQLLEDWKIIRKFMEFEKEIYKKLREGLAGTLLEATAEYHVTAKFLKEYHSERMLTTRKK